MRLFLLNQCPGGVMKEYVVLPEALYQDKIKFSQIIDMSVAYVSSLPVKMGKIRKA